jgi:hypothetical protein
MVEQICGNCEHWVRHDKEIQPVGFCTKNPPVPVLVQTQNGAAQQNLVPVTNEKAKFGCFSAKETGILRGN